MKDKNLRERRCIPCPLYRINGGRDNSFSRNFLKNYNIKGITCFVLAPKLFCYHIAVGFFFLRVIVRIKTYVWILSFQMAAARILPHGETGS